MTVRSERADDLSAIRAVIAAAFADHPFSNGKEGELVDALRAQGALSLSLVAEDDERAIVGHVALSPVEIEGCSGWHGLGPVAVEPALQRRGIGRALIDAALESLRKGGAAGCVVLGAPDYYRRFGFEHRPELRLEGAPPEFFLALPFGPSVPRGEVKYHAAFALVA